MSEKNLIIPNALWSFYEQKKETALTKEEERFFHKVFQYALRILNGVPCASNRNSLNQRAIARTAHTWLLEYKDFQKNYDTKKQESSSSRSRLGQDTGKRVITKSEVAVTGRSDALIEAMSDVLQSSVYTADGRYTMMRVRHNSVFNEKRRGEHRYPKTRD